MIDIIALRKLESKATPGPWEWEDYDLRSNSGVIRVAHGVFLGESDGFPGFEDDKEFIAAIRNALPALLDELERLREEKDGDRKAYTYWHENCLRVLARAEAAEAKLAAARAHVKEYSRESGCNCDECRHNGQLLAILDAEPEPPATVQPQATAKLGDSRERLGPYRQARETGW